MKKGILIAISVFVLAGVLVVGVKAASAQTATSPMTNFVDQLAQKLGLEKSKVQTAVDSIHKDRQAKMQQTLETKLSQAVKDGKITDAQKKAIIAKLQELQNKHQADRENFKNLTQDQLKAEMEKRKAEMTQERTNLENWAKQNNLDLSVLKTYGVFGPGMRGPGMGMHKGWK